MSGGIQSSVTTQPAPGIEGDFATANPRYAVVAGPGGLVAGAAGLLIGRFAWTSADVVDADGAPAAAENTGHGPVAGFVGRAQQGLITQYLQAAGMLIPAGFECTVFSGGDFWMRNAGTTQALPGQKAYARFADGTVRFGAPGTATGGSGSTSTVAAGTAISATGSIQGSEMKITAVSAGTIHPGTIMTGTGVATGTQVVSQVSSAEPDGALGLTGVYQVSIPEQDVDAGTALAGTYGVLTVGGTVTGTFGYGDSISGTGVTAGTQVWDQLTGTPGGAGTYVVSPSQTVASTAISSATEVETSWYARSAGLPGELVKASNVPGLG